MRASISAAEEKKSRMKTGRKMMTAAPETME